MKEGMKYAILRKLRWLSLVAVMLIGVQMDALAGGLLNPDYYYKASVKQNTGGGKVYVTNNNNTTPNANQYADSYSINNSNPVSNGDNNNVTLYLWAQPESGYVLEKWIEDANGNTVSADTPFNPTQVSRSISQRGSDNAPTFSFTAHFKKQTGLVKVASDSNGHASINNSDNGINDVVELSATPNDPVGPVFVGWTWDGNSTFFNTENPLSLTVSTINKGIYTAHFSEVGDKKYIRLQNKSTGKFISFYGDQKAVGSVESGLAFNSSLQMIDASKAQGNPETVFLKSSHTYNGNPIGADLSAHGVSYSTLVAPQYLLKFDDSGHIYTTVTVDGTESNRYLCDNGSGWLAMTDTPDASAEWYVYDLSGSSAEGAFGANTKAKYTDGEGKYYTTMFADFAYQCGEGVKAYYLPATEESYDAEEKRVYFTEISSGKVPANTAVVLECNAVQNDFSSTNKTVVNILKPILPEAAPAQIVSESGNLLKGYVSVNGSTVTNDKDKMYVLSYDNSLGFFHSTSSTMSPNKAYLNVGTVAEQNNIDVASLRYSFGRSGIDNPDNPDNPDDPTPTDLKGDINNDGQITITDVMLLLKMVSEE